MPTPSHHAMTLPRLYKRFRKRMRLKGILCAIIFTTCIHLAAIRRRAYTKEILRSQVPPPTTVTLLHPLRDPSTTPNPRPTPENTMTLPHITPKQPFDITYLFTQTRLFIHGAQPDHHLLKSLLLATNLTLHPTPQPRPTLFILSLPPLPPHHQPPCIRPSRESHTPDRVGFGIPNSHGSYILTTIANATKRHNAPHPTPPPTTPTAPSPFHQTYRRNLLHSTPHFYTDTTYSSPISHPPLHTAPGGKWPYSAATATS